MGVENGYKEDPEPTSPANISEKENQNVSINTDANEVKTIPPASTSNVPAKPPLAPYPRTPPDGAKQKLHPETVTEDQDAVPSSSLGTGDFVPSIDSSQSQAIKKKKKGRTVSWDFGAPGMADGLAGVFKDDNAVGIESADQTDVNKQQRARSGSGDEPKKGHVRRITLTDMKASPLEDEAEAAILRAIEKREMGKDQEPTFSLLTNVPKDTAHMFEEENERNGVTSIPEERQSERTESNDQGSRTSNSKYSKSSKRSDDQESVSNPMIDIFSHSNNRKKHTMKDMATQMRRMQKATANINDQSREGGYLKRLAMSKRRINVDGLDPTSIRSATTAKAGSKETEPISKAKPDDPRSHVDVLFNNASTIFGDRKQNKVESMDIESQTGTNDAHYDSASARWRKLRNVVQFTSYKKKPEEEKPESMVSMGGVSSLGMGRGDDADDLNNYNESPRQKNKNSKAATKLRRKMYRETEVLSEVYRNNKGYIRFFLKYVVLVILVPVLATASLLFYVFGNPLISETNGSYSWWLIFIGVRQVLTLALSKAFEIFFVDFCSLRTRLTLNIWGPFVTLMIVQARGWPYTLTFWAIWDFGILYGNKPFARHWLFWQNTIDMFNDTNPASITVLKSDMYMRILIAAVVAGVATAIKRVLLAVYLGKRSCQHYGPQLEKIMKRMLLLNEVGHLAQEIYDSSYYQTLAKELIPRDGNGFDFKELRKTRGEDDDDDDDDDDNEFDSIRESTRTDRTDLVNPQPDDPNETNAVPQFNVHAHFDTSDRMAIRRMVGEWQEPEIKSTRLMFHNTSINDVLQFRQAISCINDKYPFSASFGPAKTRDECIESSQDVFERLLLLTPGKEVLPFDTICLLALDNNGELDEGKLKALIRLFRPDRRGNISTLDFVKSCDYVYKSLRMFRASVANSSQIDHAMEQLVNVVFYFVILMIVLTIVRLDPWTLFLSLSGLILSFAFMFGNAASKYFDGLLFILVRRPYDIGDRIHVSDVNQDTGYDGSCCWFVEEVTLFTTTVRYGTTNEVATYSNGSLANSRLINGKRSPRALIYIYFKFGIDIPYEKVKIFRSALENFVKARPREWLAFEAFRATRVDASLGYVEYVAAITSFEAWQNVPTILNSKADVSSFGNEVAKRLEMRYTAPSLPVTLGLEGNRNDQEALQEAISLSGMKPRSVPSVMTDETLNLAAIADLFNKPEKKKTK